MEDENSLELSLGLFCGSSSSNKSKGNASESRTADGGKAEVMAWSVNVTGASLGPLFSSKADSNGLGGPQKCESFWKGQGQQTALVDDSPGYCQVLGLDGKMTVAEDKSAQGKRKMPFEDSIIQKKFDLGREEMESGRNDGVLKSHISVNSEDGSSAENEAVGESETEASNSWLMPQRKDILNNSETHDFSNKRVPRNLDHLILQEKGKGPSNVPVQESKIVHSNFPYGFLSSVPPGAGIPILMKPPNVASASNTAGASLPSVMQLTALPGVVDSSMSHSGKISTMHLPSFGYQSVQLPVLENNSSWILGSSLDKKSSSDAQINSTHFGDKMKTIQAAAFEGKTCDPLKGNGKHADDVGALSSQPGDEIDGNKPSLRPKLIPIQQMEAFPSEGSIIRPGIAPGLKFGGCGSYPDLPWVSVTGSGPNGRTISGVTYKFSKTQIKIVCACHGQHMSPEEFIQHANGNNSDGDNNVGMTSSFLNGNPAASAQS